MGRNILAFGQALCLNSIIFEIGNSSKAAMFICDINFVVTRDFQFGEVSQLSSDIKLPNGNFRMDKVCR